MNFTYCLLLLAFVSQFRIAEFIKIGTTSGRGSKPNPGNNNFGNRNQGFGSSRGSSTRSRSYSDLLRGGNTRNILMGAVAGFAAYKVGNGLFRLGRSSTGISMYDRTYYFGDRQYNRPSNQRTCSVSISDSDFGRFEYEDGQQIKTVYFTCNMRSEKCCGWDCCSNATSFGYAVQIKWWHILIIVSVICGILICAILIILRFIRKSTGGSCECFKCFQRGNGTNQNDGYQLPQHNIVPMYPTNPNQRPQNFYYPGAYGGAVQQPLLDYPQKL